jgi:hypothetical protein
VLLDGTHRCRAQAVAGTSTGPFASALRVRGISSAAAAPTATTAR